MLAEKILIIAPSWVGDMVLANSLFQTLKQQNPNVQIDVAAPAWTLPLLERMPEVSEKIALPFKHGKLALIERIKMGRQLKNEGYTQAILLVNSFKSAILPFAAGIPQRTGFLGEARFGLLNDIRPIDKSKLKKTVERFVSLGQLSGNNLPLVIPYPKLSTSLKAAWTLASSLGITKSERKVLGLCPGAEYGEAKRWPVEYYAEVAKYAAKQGFQVWLFGSEKDVDVTNKINALTHGNCIDLGGKTKLGEAIDLMSLCHTVVSNDSGLMHVAAALDKKVIAIYGSSDPLHTPPMQKNAIIEYLRLDCSPCFKRVCPLTGDANLACLKEIPATKIIAHLG
jgi:heptosyltransferase-2